MSRTIKDRPMWVDRNDRNVTEEHTCVERESACDIDVPPSASRTRGNCSYQLPADHQWNVHRCHPRDSNDLNAGYRGPERASVRDSLTGIMKGYRGENHADDADPSTDQARRAPFYGGYWD